ncbi:MAG: hypothetical protein Ta2D_04900 [Rickettsiales bacterium]|nr:MAG: hypothetical protein Ta2D_04900 [Rickettsiales bacterium]
MNDILQLQSESEILPIQLDVAKNYLRVDFDFDNQLITKLLRTAIRNCESYIGKTILEKTYILSIYKNREKIALPYPPVISINSVVGASNYTYDDVANILKISGNLQERVDVNYTAGMPYIMDEIEQGILIHTAKMYEDKTGATSIPDASIAIYQKYREIRI